MIPRKSLVVSLFLVCCLAVPTLSFAHSDADFSNSGGTLTGSSAGLSLSGSTLAAITGYNGNPMITGDLGSVSFTTGALSSGSLAMGGTFAAGGTFVITGNGTDGLNGTLFTGSFASPVTWTLTTLANGTHNYTITGALTGTMGTTQVNGVSVQLTVNTGTGFFSGTTKIGGGDTTLVGSVPEPSTLALFGTGLLSLVGRVRRKMQA